MIPSGFFRSAASGAPSLPAGSPLGCGKRRWTVGVVLGLVVLIAGLPRTGHAGAPWADMDYGPFFSATIEAPAPRTNFAYKGIAVNLGRAAGTRENEAIVFDTDLLRYAAGWSGDFVALKGVAFDGEHWAWPKTSGRQVFGTPMQPGWSLAGSFADPRPAPYGPVSRELAHWNGLHVHGDRVIFDYRVGDMDVLETPGLETGGGLRWFSRSLQLGASAGEQELEVAFETGRAGELRARDGSALSGREPGIHETLAVLGASRRQSSIVPRPEAGLLGRWEFESPDEGEVPDGSGSGRPLRLKGKFEGVEGHSGNGIEWGKGRYAEVSNADAIQPAKTDLTFAAWIRTREDGAILARASADPGWVRGGAALFVRGGRLTLDVGWVGAVASSRKIADGTWHHVAAAWAAADGAVTLYVDGEADGTGTLVARPEVASPVVRVGFVSTNFPAAPWGSGALDELRIYGRVLDPGEVAVLAGRQGESETVAVAVQGAPRGTAWRVTPDGHVRVRIPARAEPVRMKVHLWRGGDTGVARFGKAAGDAPAAEDLKPLLGGGPAHWKAALETRVRAGAETGPFAVDEIAAPDDNPWKSWLRFGAVDLFPDGDRAAIGTWNGDVWLVSGLRDRGTRCTWRRIATGLYQPLGLKIVDDRIHVLGRDQITVLEDRNGDGETDFYRNFNNDCLVGEHFHEFATDLKLGPDGNFYYVKCARHALPAAHAHHGTLLRVARDGSKLEVVARGFRAVNGLGVGPHGEFTTIDNQGHWMPGNRLNWVRPGGWYGNQWAWNPDGRTDYDPPLCWMHNFVDRSGGTQLWVPEQGWGVLGGNLITISYGMGHVFLVLKEEVAGVMQGAVTRLPFDFETGVMRGAFHPHTGDLYVCGLFGWAGNKTKPGGFYRIRPTGRPLYVATELHAVRDGVVLGFSEPLDPAVATDPGRYDLKAWNYRWSANYGSPDLKADGTEGRDTWRITSATLSADRRRVFLAVPEVRKVMQFHLVFDLRAADGAALQNFVHGTIHNVGSREGASWIGEGAIAAAGARGAAEEPVLGTEAMGLQQSFARPDGEWLDHRVVRQAALHVPSGRAATPFAEPGPFRARWRGFLRTDLSEEISFALEGTGRAKLRLNGAVVLDAAGPDLGVTPAHALALPRGLVPLELEYQSPPTGDATVRLVWSSRRVAPEPVPATALVHDGGVPELKEAAWRRAGRESFAARQCGSCHRGADPGTPGAMPELAATGASLDGLGDRLRPEWIARWLLEPRRSRPEAMMPKMLFGPGAERDAADLAAALATLTDGSGGGAAPSRDAVVRERGGKLFADLGCAGCHRLPDEKALPAESRIALAPVAAKWKPAALVAYLRHPSARHAWSRMPDFQLDAAEAEALAAFVLARTEPGAERDAMAGNGPGKGDAGRGRELLATKGCLRCHSRSGAMPRDEAPALGVLTAGKAVGRGCLATGPGNRGSAPEFPFEPGERESLAAFLAGTGVVESLLRDPVDEFALRQFARLRCAACHPRDREMDLLSKLAPAEAGGARATDDEEGATGSVHVGRPLLSYTGDKLYAGWMEKLFSGTLPGKTRPELQGRMPAFPAYAHGLAAGLAAEHGHAFESAPRIAVDAEKAEVGRRLTLVEGGFSCVSCHNVGAQRALAGKDTATVNFAAVGDRLRPTYYWRYLRDPSRVVPATMMPKFIGDDGTTPIKGVYGGDPARQFEAVWHYLQSLRPGE